MSENNKSKIVRVSENFVKVLERQREIIKKATWNSIEPSDCEVSDILAKKLIEKGLVS